jgi:hypothetical protein
MVIVGTAALLTGCGLLFGELMELRGKRDDPEAVADLLGKGIAGRLWARLAVEALVTAGLVLVTFGVIAGV